MTEEVLYDVMREGLWASVLISAPLLGVALVAGVVVGLFQALTSIQEATLTFVPKLIALAGVMMLLAPWVLRPLSDFTVPSPTRISSMGP